MLNNSSRQRATRERFENNGLPFIAAQYQGRKVTIRRDPDYRKTIGSIKKAFRAPQSTSLDRILLSALFPGYNDAIEIAEDMWAELMPGLTVVDVALEAMVVPPEICEICIYVKTLTGKTVDLSPQTNWTVGQLKLAIQDREGIPPELQRLIFLHQALEDDQILHFYGIQEGSTIHLVTILRGGKPVIYLFPPASISYVHVQLSLVKAWEFSALYPPTPLSSGISGDQSIGQTVTWTVDAKPDGSLFDHGTRRDVSYLFWEAHSNLQTPLSPASSCPGSPITAPVSLAFDPSKPIITSDNAALLSLKNVTTYIDDVLISLGLHTEARTSFITYWLPDLSKHEYVALRFLPQNEYEGAAPMDVSPTPDVVTRVFMLFKGVEGNELGAWEEARERTNQSTDTWREVVGVDVGRALDTRLFRVLEWGGMEVK